MTLACVLAGGGTGGHTVAARVIADIARNNSFGVVWIGRPDSFESRAAAEGGHRFLPSISPDPRHQSRI
jgi:UDP-N-acetylglucosamine:LPS N-acetylglucosamine transferase